MDIQPVYDVPALIAGDSFVIADLHIGVETHLMKKGFHITSRTDDMYRCILDNSDGCDRLIVLGDVKDAVPGSSKQEFREIPDFFSRLLQRFDHIDIVRGNHDTNIEEFLPSGVRVRPSTGFVLDGVGYIHGHTWPSAETMRCGTLIMAHEHPSVMFRDGIGKQTTEPCWIRGRFKTGGDRYQEFPQSFIVIPAFNRILGGSPMNLRGAGFLGPIMNNDLLDLDDARVYLLDGIDLGKRSDILIDENVRPKRKRR